MSGRPAAVIFDMDGVIFDSERAILSCWVDVAERRGIPGVEAVLRRCLGVNPAETVRIFREAYGDAFSFPDCSREATALFYERYGGGRLPVKPGAAELLERLRRESVPAALASSTPTHMVRRELAEAGLLEYFGEIVGGDRVSRSKPAPDIFLYAAELLQTDPADCWVIEDSYNGVRGAWAAGMRPIMVPDLVEPDGEMRRKARIILPTLTEVERFFFPPAEP